MQYKAPRGTKDILPADSWRWQRLEEKFRDACHLSGYSEIRTPTFEETELFTRSIGEITDIVSKEMYTFADRSERSLTLRPEGTAPVVRAWIEHNLGAEGLPTKLFYLGSMYRYERPQAGRYRQFDQFGIEAIGSDDPTIDAEVINLTAEFLRSCGAAPFTLKLNSVGTPESRADYIVALKKSVEPFVDELCGSCQTRFQQNPLRMLDCKNPQCKQLTANVPAIADYLDEDSAEHFRQVTTALGAAGLNFSIDPRLVRGFDYYTKTAFEFTVDSLGAQDAVCGGGRYDELVGEVGGPRTPAVGMAMGVERLLRVIEARKVSIGKAPHPTVFVVRLGEAAQSAGLALASKLRALSVATDLDFGNRGMKAQMKRADKSGARVALIVGDDELASGQVTARDMVAQQQWRLPLAGCAEMIQDYLTTSESEQIEAV